MIITNFKRACKSGFDNVCRNKILTLATIIAFVVSLMLISGVFLMNHIFSSFTKEIESKVDLVIYFNLNVSEDQVLNIKDEMMSVTGVQDVLYVSQTEALNNFKEKRGYDQILMRALDELGDNPLSASLNIKVADSKHYNDILGYLENSDFDDQIMNMNMVQNQEVIDNANVLVTSINITYIFLTILFSLIACIVCFNSVRIAIHNRSDEIDIMKLVGASNLFIQGPFLIEGIIYGFFGAIINLIIYLIFMYAMSIKLGAFFGMFGVSSYFFSNFFLFALINIGAGVLFGILSSFFAVSKYLKKSIKHLSWRKS